MATNDTEPLRSGRKIYGPSRHGHRRRSRDGPGLPLHVLTLADEALPGQALALLLSQSKLIAEARYAGPLEAWESALTTQCADALVWFGSCADRRKLEVVDSIRCAHDLLAVCLVVERVETLALRAVIRRGADRLAVVLRTPELELGDVLKSLVQLASGHATLSPEVLERLVVDQSVESDRLDKLTASEHQVLRLLSTGLRNHEIARRLGTSQKGVERKVTRIFTKLGLQQGQNDAVDRRVMAARMFVLRRGCADTAA